AISPELVHLPFTPALPAPPQSSPPDFEGSSALPTVPPIATAPRSAPRTASGVRPGLPVVPSTSSQTSLATVRATMTAPGAPSPQRLRATPRTPSCAEPSPSRKDEVASRQVHVGVSDSRPAGSPEHPHARFDKRPTALATHDRQARLAPIAQSKTAAPPGAG